MHSQANDGIGNPPPDASKAVPGADPHPRETPPLNREPYLPGGGKPQALTLNALLTAAHDLGDEAAVEYVLEIIELLFGPRVPRSTEARRP